MNEKIKGTYAIAHRIVNAENNFIETAMEMHGLSKANAEKVLRVYRKLKMVSTNYGVGKITVKHGAFWDKEYIDAAVAFEN